MKKDNIILAAVFVVFLGLITAIYINEPITGAVSKKSDVDLTFAVLGDVHENISSFQKAIDDLHTIDPNMDALILNGDNVDQGIEKQYNSMKKVINKDRNLLPKTIIKNIGNHEFFNYNIKVNSPAQVQTFINRYLDFAGEKKVYHDAWVNNYHFISLGSEDGNSETLNSVTASISVEQQEWLKVKLAENYEKDKPIFVFLHQPLDFGNGGWVGVKQSEQIKEILSKYPEVILFSSHMHRDLNADSVETDKPFTIISTGAVHYTIVPDKNSKGGRKREPYIKGLYIEVKGNKVVVNGRDFKEKRWIFKEELNRR